jgi:hypothetical protein
MDKPLVLISWNGREAPLRCLLRDGVPQFDLVVFDYSGQADAQLLRQLPWPVVLLSEVTQCKGDIYQALAKYLNESNFHPRFVSLIDDDIIISVNDINRVLHLGELHDLHVFSPTLSHDSQYTHRWTLRQPNRMLRPVDWVEVMMPFYHGDLFLAAAPYYEGNISSWGIDKYLIPTWGQLKKMTRTVLIDAVMACHYRPITSGRMVYRNGLTAGQERDRMRQACLDLIAGQAPELQQSAWFDRIFKRRHVRTRWQQVIYRIGRPLRRWLERST